MDGIFTRLVIAEPTPAPERGHSLRDGDEGPEKFCGTCREWWPADPEFFCRDSGSPSGLFHACKACCADHQRATRDRKKQQQAQGAH